MSTVAKIFVVLNFVLAAVFLGSAAAFLGHHDNWKVKHAKDTAELTARVNTLIKEKAEVTDEKNKLAGNVGQATKDRDEARSNADVLKTAYDTMKKSYDELNASLANESKALQTAQSTIANGRTLVDELQKERQTLIDSLTKAMEEKNAAIKMQNQLELNLEQLQTAQTDMAAKLSTSDTALQRTTFELQSIKARLPGITRHRAALPAGQGPGGGQQREHRRRLPGLRGRRQGRLQVHGLPREPVRRDRPDHQRPGQAGGGQGPHGHVEVPGPAGRRRHDLALRPQAATKPFREITMAKDSFESHDEMDAPASRADGLGNAVIVLTAIILLAAIIVMQQAMGNHFGAGMFGK